MRVSPYLIILMRVPVKNWPSNPTKNQVRVYRPSLILHPKKWFLMKGTSCLLMSILVFCNLHPNIMNFFLNSRGTCCGPFSRSDDRKRACSTSVGPSFQCPESSLSSTFGCSPFHLPCTSRNCCLCSHHSCSCPIRMHPRPCRSCPCLCLAVAVGTVQGHVTVSFPALLRTYGVDSTNSTQLSWDVSATDNGQVVVGAVAPASTRPMCSASSPDTSRRKGIPRIEYPAQSVDADAIQSAETLPEISCVFHNIQLQICIAT